MKKYSSKVFPLLFSVLFLFSFSFIALNIIFNKSVYSYNTFALIFFTFLSLLTITAIAYSVRKHISFFEKHYSKILILSLLYLFTIQMILFPFLRFDPIYDLEAVYRGAIDWVEKGTFVNYDSPTCHKDYFYIFPNNLGTMSFFAAIFSVAKLIGIEDYFFVATVTNSILICLTMFFTSKVCYKLFGTLGGIISIILFLLTPPFYLMATSFYTDSLSMIFPMSAFWTIISAKESVSYKKKVTLYLLASVLCFVGALIKMTVLILAIAVMIVFFMKQKWKELLIFSIIAITIIPSLFVCFNSIMYSTMLDKEKADNVNMPVHYWIDLAFTDTGKYKNSIYVTARKEKDPDKRKEILTEDIKNKISDLKIVGIYNLFENKSTRLFGDGTFALSDFLDDRPENQNKIHEYITYKGEKYKNYSLFATAIFLSNIILMLFSVKFKNTSCKSLIPQLAVFGIMFFLLLWETNSRYITTFIPFIFVCSANGICGILKYLSEKTGYYFSIHKK